MNEIIIVDKPYGLTSSYVVNKLKKYFGASKAGHSGTLDPLATGVLVIYFDDMTKIIPYIDESVKKYNVKILLGLGTDTLDISGKIINLSNIKNYTKTDLKEVVSSFEGEYNYRPPIFSAIKIKGTPSYKLARKGRSVDLPIKNSYINKIDIIEYGASTINLEIESSKGTYVRALARDIGLSLGSHATVSKLRRTKTGKFDISESNDFYSILAGCDPIFFSIKKLFTVVEVEKKDITKIANQKNFKNVNLSEFMSNNNKNSIIVISCQGAPILIATNKFGTNGVYISSEIKFFNKKN
jgi:tRNA pseudouridine55 synthase